MGENSRANRKIFYAISAPRLECLAWKLAETEKRRPRVRGGELGTPASADDKRDSSDQPIALARRTSRTQRMDGLLPRAAKHLVLPPNWAADAKARFYFF
jgi:hypothetical protein